MTMFRLQVVFIIDTDCEDCLIKRTPHGRHTTQNAIAYVDARLSDSNLLAIADTHTIEEIKTDGSGKTTLLEKVDYKKGYQFANDLPESVAVECSSTPATYERYTSHHGAKWVSGFDDGLYQYMMHGLSNGDA